MDRFLQLVSHELRTPITSLKINLEMATRSRRDPSGTREEEQQALPERTVLAAIEESGSGALWMPR